MPERSSRRKPLIATLLVTVLAVAAGAGGYAIASAGGEDLEAARERGARAGEREDGSAVSDAGWSPAAKREKAAYRTAYRKASKRAYKTQLAAARRKAARAAAQQAAAQQAAAARQAEAQRAEAAERAENCNAPLFVSGYCPTDEEIETEQSAESLCGPGTEEGRREAAEQGIQC